MCFATREDYVEWGGAGEDVTLWSYIAARAIHIIHTSIQELVEEGSSWVYPPALTCSLPGTDLTDLQVSITSSNFIACKFKNCRKMQVCRIRVKFMWLKGYN